MVPQMIDKFTEYRLANNGAVIMPTGDKQQSLSVKKVALRDLPNETRNIITKPQGNSPLPKEGGSIADSLSVSGMKRHHPDWPAGPSHRQSTCNNGTNRHLVYVRRKLETETSKISSCDDVVAAISPKSGKFSENEKKEFNCQQDQMQKPMFSCFPAFSPIPAVSVTASSRGPLVPYSLGMPTTRLPVMNPNCSMVSTGMPVLFNASSTSNLHWKERSLQLQMFLNNCDQSSQKEYTRMLRSLSAADRSKHAVELEKRAMRLLMEEADVLLRMRAHNVLGKVSHK